MRADVLQERSDEPSGLFVGVSRGGMAFYIWKACINTYAKHSSRSPVQVERISNAPPFAHFRLWPVLTDYVPFLYASLILVKGRILSKRNPKFE